MTYRECHSTIQLYTLMWLSPFQDEHKERLLWSSSNMQTTRIGYQHHLCIKVPYKSRQNPWSSLIPTKPPLVLELAHGYSPGTVRANSILLSLRSFVSWDGNLGTHMENEPAGNNWVAKKKGISMFRALGLLPPISLPYGLTVRQAGLFYVVPRFPYCRNTIWLFAARTVLDGWDGNKNQWTSRAVPWSVAQ
jgi:hypothetical protein